MASFFTYFTSGFGTLFLVALLVSLVTGERVDTGAFGLIGFPLLALLYAIARKVSGRAMAVDVALEAKKLDDVYGHPRYADFLSEDQERQYIYKEQVPERFSEWFEAKDQKNQAEPAAP